MAYGSWRELSETLAQSVSPFLASHLIFLFWIRYQAQYHAERGIRFRSECWCLTALVMSSFKGGWLSPEKGLF